MIENALLAIVCNAIGGLIATYIARAIDNKRKMTAIAEIVVINALM